MAQESLSLTKLAVALGVSLILSSGAYATGNDEYETKPCHSIPGACDNKPGHPRWAKFPHQPKPQTPPSNPVSVEQNQQQKQGDVSGVVKGHNEIKDSGNGYGGIATATSQAGDHTSSLDASDHSSTKYESNHESTYIHLPPMPSLPPIVSQQGEVKQVITSCGPLQKVVSRRDVNGVFVGAVKDTKIPLGEDDKLEPYKDDTGKIVRYHKGDTETDGSFRMYGHQAIITTTALNTSGARQISLGVYGSGGGGQGGVGGTGSMNQFVTTIQLIDCEHSVYKPASKEVAQEAPKVQLQTGEIRATKKVTRSCYRVTDNHPLNKKPAGMAVCPSQGGVRSYTSTEPGERRDIITEVTSGKKTYRVDDSTGKFVEEEVK